MEEAKYPVIQYLHPLFPQFEAWVWPSASAAKKHKKAVIGRRVAGEAEHLSITLALTGWVQEDHHKSNASVFKFKSSMFVAT